MRLKAEFAAHQAVLLLASLFLARLYFESLWRTKGISYIVTFCHEGHADFVSPEIEIHVSEDGPGEEHDLKWLELR